MGAHKAVRMHKWSHVHLHIHTHTHIRRQSKTEWGVSIILSCRSVSTQALHRCLCPTEHTRLQRAPNVRLQSKQAHMLLRTRSFPAAQRCEHKLTPGVLFTGVTHHVLKHLLFTISWCHTLMIPLMILLSQTRTARTARRARTACKARKPT